MTQKEFEALFEEAAVCALKSSEERQRTGKSLMSRVVQNEAGKYILETATVHRGESFDDALIRERTEAIQDKKGSLLDTIIDSGTDETLTEDVEDANDKVAFMDMRIDI